MPGSDSTPEVIDLEEEADARGYLASDDDASEASGAKGGDTGNVLRRVLSRRR